MTIPTAILITFSYAFKSIFKIISIHTGWPLCSTYAHCPYHAPGSMQGHLAETAFFWPPHLAVGCILISVKRSSWVVWHLLGRLPGRVVWRRASLKDRIFGISSNILRLPVMTLRSALLTPKAITLVFGEMTLLLDAQCDYSGIPFWNLTLTTTRISTFCRLSNPPLRSPSCHPGHGHRVV